MSEKRRFFQMNHTDVNQRWMVSASLGGTASDQALCVVYIDEIRSTIGKVLIDDESNCSMNITRKQTEWKSSRAEDYPPRYSGKWNRGIGVPWGWVGLRWVSQYVRSGTGPMSHPGCLPSCSVAIYECAAIRVYHRADIVHIVVVVVENCTLHLSDGDKIATPGTPRLSVVQFEFAALI